MANIKSFIHANAIVAERVGSETFNFYGGFPYSDIIGLPRGWGKMYLGRAGQNVWFHAAVPSPAVTSSVRVLLDGVFVFFRTHDGSGSSSSSKNCYMSNLDVWDGSNLVKQFASLHSSGEHQVNPVMGVNAFSVRDDSHGHDDFHTMNWGLNISMLFNFIEESTILFSSAGGSFIVS